MFSLDPAGIQTKTKTRIRIQLIKTPNYVIESTVIPRPRLEFEFKTRRGVVGCSKVILHTTPLLKQLRNE